MVEVAVVDAVVRLARGELQQQVPVAGPDRADVGRGPVGEDHVGFVGRRVALRHASRQALLHRVHDVEPTGASIPPRYLSPSTTCRREIAVLRRPIPLLLTLLVALLAAACAGEADENPLATGGADGGWFDLAELDELEIGNAHL